MRRPFLHWVVAGALLLVATTGGVLLANATALGPGAFVQVYLDALARGDARTALSMPGVDTGTARTDLLTRGALRPLGDIRQLSDTATADGGHRIEFGWTSGARTGRSTFEVRSDGTRFGLFPQWRFATSPTTDTAVQIVGDATFDANGSEHALVAGHTDYAMLVPGVYVFDRDTELLSSDAVAVVADTPGTRGTVSITAHATAAFVGLVEKAVHASLDECATSTALLPANCPFGEEVTDRITSTPAWSIDRYPSIALRPGRAAGEWVAPTAQGAARLKVDIRSLFDGSVSTFDRDVPFSVSYTVRIGADGVPSIVAMDASSG